MRHVNIKILKDGSGRVCIHWFCRQAEEGPTPPIQTNLKVVQTPIGPLRLGGAKGHIACQPTLKTIVPQNINGTIVPLINSDDVRAVTCPACIATPEFKAAQEFLEQALAGPVPAEAQAEK